MQQVDQRTGLILQALVLPQVIAVDIRFAHGSTFVLAQPWLPTPCERRPPRRTVLTTRRAMNCECLGSRLGASGRRALRWHAHHLDFEATTNRLGVFLQRRQRRRMLQATTTSFQPCHHRWLRRHELGHLSLGESSFLPGAQQFIEQRKLLRQTIVFTNKLRILPPFAQHFIVCLHRSHFSPRLCTSARRLRATSSSLAGVFCDFLM